MKPISWRHLWKACCENGVFVVYVVAVAGTLAGIICRVRWDLYGETEWLNWYFRFPNAILLALLGLVELGFRVFALRQFAPSDAMRRGWIFLSISAGLHFVGRTMAAIAGILPAHAGSSLVRSWGEMVGGPLQMAALLAGLCFVAARMKRLGLWQRWTTTDRFLLVLVAALTVRTFYGIVLYCRSGREITFFRVVGWFSDPLLLALLVGAIFLWRVSGDLGQGPLARCWQTLVFAIVCTSVGDFSLWCGDCHATPQWTTLGWHVWLIADAAYALAPAYQVAAIVRVQARRQSLETIRQSVVRPAIA